MCVLLMLLAALLHATSTVNALECLTGFSFEVKVPSKKASNEGSVNLWNLTECPAGVERCMKVTCTLDTKAMGEIAPGKPIPDGVHSTITAKGCMERGKCEIPDEADGNDLRKIKKYCDVWCSTAEATNGGGTEATNGGGTEATNGGGTEATNGGGTEATNGGGIEATKGGGTEATNGGGTEATNGGGKAAEQGVKNLRSFGTVAAMIAFVAAFFLHWN